MKNKTLVGKDLESYQKSVEALPQLGITLLCKEYDNERYFSVKFTSVEPIKIEDSFESHHPMIPRLSTRLSGIVYYPELSIVNKFEKRDALWYKEDAAWFFSMLPANNHDPIMSLVEIPNVPFVEED